MKFKLSDIKVLLAKPLTELTHDELLRRAQYLEVENAYLKKLEAILAQARIPNSTYYQVSIGNKYDPYLDAKCYGHRQVQIGLGHQNHYLNHYNAQRLMTQMGIKSTIKSKRYQSHKGSNVKVAPSLLHSQIKVDE